MADEKNKPKKKEDHWLKEWLVYGKSSFLLIGQIVILLALWVLLSVFLKSCN